MYRHSNLINIAKDLNSEQFSSMLFSLYKKSNESSSSKNDIFFNSYGKDKEYSYNLRKNIKEGCFRDGLKCPKCGCSKINKNGITNNRQRYICKNCRRTFDEMSFSPLSSTKLSLDKWLKYCELMTKSLSIRKCAKIINVSIPTSFFMRHRILDMLNLYFENNKLNGIIELGQYYIEESFKGNHSKNNNFRMNRPAKKTGLNKYPNKFDDDNSEKICIQTAIDRKNNIITKVACKGYLKSSNIAEFFNNKLGENAIFCISSNRSFPHIIDLHHSDLDIKLVRVPIYGNGKVDIYNLRHVNKFHRNFSKWIKTFNGVATKYLNNYLAWFKFFYLSSTNKLLNKIYNLFFNMVTIELKITKVMIKERFIQLMT